MSWNWGLLDDTIVSEDPSHWPKVPGIYTSEQIQAWKVITDAVHAKGGSIYFQLRHLGRADMSAKCFCFRYPIVFGSHIVDQYKQEAFNSLEAGFNGVEIHGANGYVLDQLVQSNSNKRTDQYGGSVENRDLLLLELHHHSDSSRWF